MEVAVRPDLSSRPAIGPLELGLNLTIEAF
jgi:hypothetical protein